MKILEHSSASMSMRFSANVCETEVVHFGQRLMTTLNGNYAINDVLLGVITNILKLM